MSIQELTRNITSFAAMTLNAGRIRQIVGQTGEEYIGKIVIETMPNGKQAEAMIMAIEWCASCGLNGEWMIYIAYTDEKSAVPGAWVGKSVLSLKDGE